MLKPVQVLPIAGTLLTALLVLVPYATAQDANPTLTTLHSFAGSPSDGTYPYAGVVVDGDGVLLSATVFGGASGGPRGYGTVLSLKAPETSGGSWTESILHNFNGGSQGYGTYPYGTLVIGRGPGGHPVLYGTTSGGESTGLWGTVFVLTPPQSPDAPWIATNLYVFTGGSDGAYPVGGVAIGDGGVLYGTTSAGGIAPGASGYGTVFSLTPPATGSRGAWTQAVLYSFLGGISGSDGAIPEASVAIGRGAGGHPVLYGTTFSGGASGYGTVFSLTPPDSGQGGAWTETVLHNFAGGTGDGFNPNGGVVIGSGGVLYGTTESGGAFLIGAVFSLTPPASGEGGAWTETLLHSFAGGSDGAFADAGVAIGGGVLYGTTYNGGTSGLGTVFSLTPPTVSGGPWTEKVLHSFTGGGDGANPEATVAIYGGTLYGTTFYGGSSGNGTVFSLAP